MKFSSKIISAILFFLMTTNAMAWVDIKIQNFLDKLNASGGKPMEQMAPKDAREVLVNAQKSNQINLSGIDVKNKSIQVNGKTISLTIVRPANVKSKLPVFMFFHGGGWVIGDFKTHERFVRDLVVNSGIAAVFVNYSLSPEVHYPVALNECYEATKWVAEHGNEINVDGHRLAVVGNSAGGNLATAVALLAKEKGTPKIKYQILFWPVTNAAFDNESYNKFASGYFLTKNMMKWFWDSYITDPKQREEILASPMRATTEQLKNTPPALIIVAENDVLRDEGETYAGNLDAAGVPVIAVRYDGLIHDFGLLNAISDVPSVQAALRQAAAELKKNL